MLLPGTIWIKDLTARVYQNVLIDRPMIALPWMSGLVPDDTVELWATEELEMLWFFPVGHKGFFKVIQALL